MSYPTVIQTKYNSPNRNEEITTSRREVYLKNLMYFIVDEVFRTCKKRSKDENGIFDIDSKALIESAKLKALVQTQKEGFF